MRISSRLLCKACATLTHTQREKKKKRKPIRHYWHDCELQSGVVAEVPLWGLRWGVFFWNGSINALHVCSFKYACRGVARHFFHAGKEEFLVYSAFPMYLLLFFFLLKKCFPLIIKALWFFFVLLWLSFPHTALLLSLFIFPFLFLFLFLIPLLFLFIKTLFVL